MNNAAVLENTISRVHLLAQPFYLNNGREEGVEGVDSARNCSDHEETTAGEDAGSSSPRRDNLFPLQFRQYNARVKILPELYNRAHPPLYFFLSVFGEIEAT